jgi:gamma-glutamylcyclotransferase (GGCT)/AIG2-like uncharacterized protein YtfP
MAHIFTYGSLMFNEVWGKLTKGNYRFEKGLIEGYARRCVKEEEYPAIFKANESVRGIIYYDVNDEDLTILDDFEGEFYERTTLKAILENLEHITVEAYVLKNKYHDIIDDRAWNEAYFEQEGIKRFIERYKGFIS